MKGVEFAGQSTRAEGITRKVAPEIRIGVFLNLLLNTKCYVCRMELYEATISIAGEQKAQQLPEPTQRWEAISIHPV